MQRLESVSSGMDPRQSQEPPSSSSSKKQQNDLLHQMLLRRSGEHDPLVGAAREHYARGGDPNLLARNWRYPSSVASSLPYHNPLSLLDRQAAIAAAVQRSAPSSFPYAGMGTAYNASPFGLGSAAVAGLSTPNSLSYLSMYPGQAELTRAAATANTHPLMAGRPSAAVSSMDPRLVGMGVGSGVDPAAYASYREALAEEAAGHPNRHNDPSEQAPPHTKREYEHEEEEQAMAAKYEHGGPVKKRLKVQRIQSRNEEYQDETQEEEETHYEEEAPTSPSQPRYNYEQRKDNSARSRYNKIATGGGAATSLGAALGATNHHQEEDSPARAASTSPIDSPLAMSRQGARSKSSNKSRGTKSTEEQWNIMFQRLLAYKKIHGDCLVPQRCESDPKLGKWVCYQRKRKSNLSEERRRKLEEVGFVFSVRQLEPWEAMFDQLVEYKEKHGDCLVPQNHKDNPKLGKWVAIQRIYKDSLTKERMQRMVDIGFVWSVNQALWDTMFQSLVEYKEANGHCRVPWNYRADPQLANWVQRQRKNKKRLTVDRLERLQELGLEL